MKQLLKTYQKELRKNLTDAETQLWYFFRNRSFHGFKFRRQAKIRRFIVDFICYEKKLIIELDGGQHSEQELYDARRTRILEKEGFYVLRFWNDDFLKNKDLILEIIYEGLTKHPSSGASRQLLPQGEKRSYFKPHLPDISEGDLD